MPIPCFLLEATDRATRALWRSTYAQDRAKDCPSGWGWHHARRVIGRQRIRLLPKGTYRVPVGRLPHVDRRWPRTCDACGARLGRHATYHQGGDRLYRRTDTGAELELRDAPPGAIWRADWYEEFWPGPDGRSYVCQTPGGPWAIDGQASNCTDPESWKLPAGDPGRHWCWIRHGEPPHFTVDKNGRTCKAGAGSIQSGSYHGFLQGGVLT
jgi:hypothetical protein